MSIGTHYMRKLKLTMFKLMALNGILKSSEEQFFFNLMLGSHLRIRIAVGQVQVSVFIKAPGGDSNV